jgi:fumarate reductase flavoprotein subunit
MPNNSTRLPEEAGLVVIGGGGAGTASAVAAAESGVENILLLEKRSRLGGTSALASGIFACESPVQARQKIVADRDDLFRRAMDWHHWRQVDPKIIRAFVNRSGDTVRWLESKGVEFQLIRFYPDQVPLLQHNAVGRGAHIVKAMADDARQRNVTFITNIAVRNILRDDFGRVRCMRVVREGKEAEIRTPAVVIATGGFAGNPELLKRFCPVYSPDLILSGLPLTGDGLVMAEKAGAAIADFATVLREGPRLDARGWPLRHFERDPMALWVNRDGKRFIDETMGYHIFESVNALLAQPGGVSFALFDSTILDIFRIEMPDIDNPLEAEIAKGRVLRAESLPQIAEQIGCEPAILEATVARYNLLCERGYDEDYGKEHRYLKTLATPPFYGIKGICTFLDTIGGVIINEHMEVLDPSRCPIPGLYAAGTVTSGWESEVYCSELSASAFGFAINSGRIAGESAAAFLNS